MKKNLRILALGAALISGISITHDAFAMEQEHSDAKKARTNVFEKLSNDVFTAKILSAHFDKQELLNLRLINKETTGMIDGKFHECYTTISYAPGKNIQIKNLLMIAQKGIIRDILTLDLTKPIQEQTIALRLITLSVNAERKDYITHKLKEKIPYFSLANFPNILQIKPLQNNIFVLRNTNGTETIWQLNNDRFQQIQNPALTNIRSVTALQNNLFALCHTNDTATIWQLNNGQFQQIQNLNRPNVRKISPLLHSIFILFDNDHTVTYWQLNNGQFQQIFIQVDKDLTITFWQRNNGQSQQIQDIRANVIDVTAPQDNLFELRYDDYQTITIWQLKNGQFQQIQGPNLTNVQHITTLQNNLFALKRYNDTTTIAIQIPTEELSPLTAALVVKLWHLKSNRETTALHADWQRLFDTLPQYAKNELLETVATI